MPEDTCNALTTLFHSLGATLHLSPAGALTVRPAAVARDHRQAIQRHLCGLLVHAAIQEVQRLMRHAPPERWEDFPAELVPSAELASVCDTGDVDATRTAAVAFIGAWSAWLCMHKEER